MGSLFPFQDLNVPVQSLITPKIEPNIDPSNGQHLQSQNEPNPNPQNLQFQLPEPGITQEDQNAYAEFLRVSELFRAALSKGKHGEVEVLPQELAIVPHHQQQNGFPEVVSTTTVVSRAMKQRSAEMIRMLDLTLEQQIYYRNEVRMTRMLYESLRLFLLQEEANGLGKRCRADLRAGSLLKDMGLWLNRDKRLIGSIPGVYIGDVFFYRMELCVLGLHGQGQAGIDYVPISQSPTGEPVATSIIVSGGYEDDEDAGDVIIYTGHGGQARNTLRQCVDQKLEGGNLALERSMYHGIEVRVIRGIPCDMAPVGKVYVYDGLYKVVEYWFETGKSGFGVFKYKIVRMPNQPEIGSSIFKFAAELRIRPLSVRPSGYLSLDISKGKEKLPVSVYNDIDSDQSPLHYVYLVKPIYPSSVFPKMGNGRGCDCRSGCSSGCYCAQRNGAEFPYDQNGILLRGKPLIYECGAFCQCPPTCKNRVSQHGMKYQLEIFRSRETGWGVRPLSLIPAGSFICEYTGVVLTQQQAAIFTMNGDSLVNPRRFPERWVEWGDISQVFPVFTRPTFPPAPFLDFAMDVSRMRNVACYFSHNSPPNVLVQFVMYDQENVFCPRLILFAMENIPPLEELSLDYGLADEWTEQLAICN